MKAVITLLTLFFLKSSLLADGAEEFIQTTPFKNASIFKKIDDDLVENGKFADIYYIHEEGKVVAVLKEFHKVPSSTRDYQKEIRAFEELKRSKTLPYSPLIVHGEDSNYYFIIMQCAKGSSLNSQLKEIGKSSWGRILLLKNFLKGVKKTGASLRAFHQKTLTTSANPSRAIFERQRFDYFYSRTPIKGVDLEKLSYLEKSLKETPMLLGQVHGDLHIGNIFFDPKTEEVTFIDFSTLSNSKKGGIPVASDAMKLVISLKVLGKTYGLSSKEIKQIEDAFFEGYGTDMLSYEEMAYYTLLELLNLIECYDQENELAPIYQCSVQLLKETLDKNNKTT